MQKRWEHAVIIAREAGNLTLEYFNNPGLVVEQKNDYTPVTAADRKTELLLRERIVASFPHDAILGEEFPLKQGTSGYRWILDPIDGTKAFIHGVPLYGTLIGIEYEGKPVIGVIRLPALNETLWAMCGKGAWHESSKLAIQPQRARVSKCNDLKKSLFLTSTIMTYQTGGREKAFQEIAQKSQLVRTWGDAYGYFLVATGRAEIMIDPVMSVWDAAPFLTILEESGGRFTDWQGNPTIDGNEGVATNGLLHDEIIRITKTCLKQGSDKA
ncbi:MAG: histidinol-phosphatase [Planctomycetaceae bacterium]|jgi:histidinol phosphatase-like enzyme (inositol monophosphatase family)|nr:histidinol-phosphatase [Planctomycetaceae bacterium]